MYSKAEFAPLSQASLKRLMKGHTVRVKHGTGLHLGLSKMQMKKHISSKKKGQGGYNMTMDPYQCQMHGEGFFDDVSAAFKKLGSSFVENVAKPVANEIIQEGKTQGRKVASKLIHEGIPFASEALGGLAGSTLGGLTGNPLGVDAGEVMGQQLGAYGGKKLADYVGKKTGYGTKKLTKAMLKKLHGGTLLIDEPITARQVVNNTGNFFKNPGKTLGFGLPEQTASALQRLQGKGSFDNYMLAQALMGYGFEGPLPSNRGPIYRGRGHGGTLLIDEPITTRQVVNNTGNFFKNPGKTLGFGMKKGGALKQAGY